MAKQKQEIQALRALQLVTGSDENDLPLSPPPTIPTGPTIHKRKRTTRGRPLKLARRGTRKMPVQEREDTSEDQELDAIDIDDDYMITRSQRRARGGSR